MENPVLEVSKPRIRNNRTRFLSKEEAQLLLDCAKTSKNKKLFPYLLVLMHTGMRPSEAAGLKWTDVDLENRLVKLQVTKTDMRYVPLTETAESVLRSIQPTEVENNGYVFLPQSSLRSASVMNVPCLYFKKSFGTVRIKAGLEDVHLHDLRHTFASLSIEAGTDLYVVQNQIGHASYKTTQRYAHIATQRMKTATENVADEINKAITGS